MILSDTITAIIPDNDDGHPGGWGMFRLFNLVEIDTNFGSFDASNTKMCSCKICEKTVVELLPKL